MEEQDILNITHQVETHEWEAGGLDEYDCLPIVKVVLKSMAELGYEIIPPLKNKE